MSNIKDIAWAKRKHWLALESKSKNQMKPVDLYKFDRRIFDRLRGRAGRGFERLMLSEDILREPGHEI